MRVDGRARGEENSRGLFSFFIKRFDEVLGAVRVCYPVAGLATAARGEGVEDEIKALGEEIAQVFLRDVGREWSDGFGQIFGISAHAPDEMALTCERSAER